MVTRAIELNEQLERILQRHDALISRRTTLISTHIDHEQAGEEEEAEQLLRRLIYCNTLRGDLRLLRGENISLNRSVKLASFLSKLCKWLLLHISSSSISLAFEFELNLLAYTHTNCWAG